MVLMLKHACLDGVASHGGLKIVGNRQMKMDNEPDLLYVGLNPRSADAKPAVRYALCAIAATFSITTITKKVGFIRVEQ
eukprot:scaffold181807_cov17-Prasinocladus_malaysianus.AAC.1